MVDNKVTTITNPIPLSFGTYFNATDWSDTTVEVQSSAGERLGALKAHKVILCQNNAFKKMLDNNKIITITGTLAAAETFVNYVYTNAVEKTKLTIDLWKIAVTFEDEFLKKACENNVVENLKRLPFNEIVDEFLLALENANNVVWAPLAKHIAENYREFKGRQEFSRIFDNKQAAGVLFDAHESIIEQMKNRLKAKKLQFELKLSWAEKAVFEFKESSGKWKFSVYRAHSENEDWLYFNCEAAQVNYSAIQHLFVKLLPNSDLAVSEKICEANKQGATKFLRWAYVMDPKNGYIKGGEIKMELEFIVVCIGVIAVRKSAPSLHTTSAKRFKKRGCC